MTTCENVERTHALADGELTGAIADTARDHLADCEVCQTEFADALQLDAAVHEAPANVISIAWYRQRKLQLVGVALAAAASVAVYVGIKPKSAPPDQPTQVAIALAPKRGVEARLTWSDASAYRPYDVPRGDAPKENVPLSVLGEVEKRGDLHGVAVLAMLDGDKKQAATYFDKAGDAIEVQIDRAALALGDGDAAKALGLVDAVLEKDPQQPVALWNKALALRDLGLPRAAAAAFRDVAKRNEPGWAAEATARAKALDTATDAERDLTIRVLGAGPQLAKDGTGLSLEDAKKLPGFSRLLFYDALRAAPTAERIAKLRPLAEAIDQGTHANDLVAAIERAKPRGALAETYADIIAKQAAGDWDHLPAREPYLKALRDAKADDLLIGALIKLAPGGRTVAAADLPEFDKLTASSPDRWMQLLGIEQKARLAIAANDLSHIEATLLEGRKQCASGGPAYRCMKIEMMLGDTYIESHRMDEARPTMERAWKLARNGSEWLSELDIIPLFAKMANLADDTAGAGLALARAYADELRRRGPDEELRHSPHDYVCDRDVWGRYVVANVLVDQLRLEDARAEIAAAPKCDYEAPPSDVERRLFIRAHTVAVGTDAELSALRADIASLRASKNLSVGERAFLDHIEGRAMIDRDAKTGEALLRSAIATAKTAPEEVAAAKASAWSYALLAIAQAKRGDGGAALETLAEEIGVEVPTRCVVGLAADLRVAAVIRDATGKLVTRIQPRRLDGKPPEDLQSAVAGCPVVDVLARPPFHGRSRLLPTSIAWRYLSARARPRGLVGTRHVVVDDVEPPASLSLPRLAAWSTPGDRLSGASATPANVLAAMSDAAQVVVNAHGIVDQVDSSYLALSADAAGHYALTALDVRSARFKSSPVVVLAACRASQAAPVLHKSWSLPTAFVYAGARAVIASSSPIPDAETESFFGDLEKRLASGSDVAVALRDSRIGWRGGDWVNDLVVFE